MSTQITIRLPDADVAHIDELVGAGRAPSRAGYIAKALTRERRREAAERDLEILLAERAAGGDDPDDLEALHAWAARRRLDLD